MSGKSIFNIHNLPEFDGYADSIVHVYNKCYIESYVQQIYRNDI